MISVVTDFMDAMSNSKKRVVVTTVSVVIFWVFVLWALGAIPALGAGFARAEDVKSIQAQLLEEAIIEARIRYCTAPNGHPTKRFFLTAVNDKLAAYKLLTDREYSLPLCEELVVASGN